jgi:serine protease Do
MERRLVLWVVLFCIAGAACFGQTAALRDYVGMISQGLHPDIITILEKLKIEFEKRHYTSAARALDRIIKGDSGTGFVYVGSDGKNYILTNYHVISQAHTLSTTFETQDGEKTKFSDLSIVAADVDMDIALLAFAGGQNPLKQGLTLLTRTVEEGEDVYSAGFPGTITGSAMIWQLGRGIVSNASVRLPAGDDSDKMIGPYIQHTAQIDPGNSGGPLLVQVRGVPTGFAVAGINTLQLIGRQNANCAIPVTRVRTFLDASLKPQAADQRPILEERVNTFIKDLSAPKAVYPHIATFLSNTCVGENAEFALSETLDKAPKSVTDNIFDRGDIIAMMTYSVAWTIENSLRSRGGGISVTLDSINPGENGMYNVSLNVNNNKVDSVWVNEYGIWRIRKFGTSASGDKNRIEKKKLEKADAERLKDNPILMISAGLASFEFGPAFGAELILKGGKYFGIGPRVSFGKNFTQIEMGLGPYVPIKIGQVALTPFATAGVGLMFITNNTPNYDYQDQDPSVPIGASVRAGMSFTTSWVPGLFIEAAYHRNFYIDVLGGINNIHPNMFYIAVGYAF